MELYERIRYLAETKKVSLAKMAKDLGIPQQTFHQWLKPGSQKNIWEHLPAILERFPDVQPAWLYMDEPPAFQDGTGPVKAAAAPDMGADVEALRAEVAQLRAELREEARRNQQLRTRLLVDGVGDKDAPSATGKASGGHG